MYFNDQLSRENLIFFQKPSKKLVKREKVKVGNQGDERGKTESYFGSKHGGRFH